VLGIVRGGGDVAITEVDGREQLRRRNADGSGRGRGGERVAEAVVAQLTEEPDGIGDRSTEQQGEIDAADDARRVAGDRDYARGRLRSDAGEGQRDRRARDLNCMRLEGRGGEHVRDGPARGRQGNRERQPDGVGTLHWSDD
jgi:hypothetical protein